MITVEYAPEFVRSWKKLPIAVQDEAIERIEQFKDPKNHVLLKVHKLNGRMKGKHAFSINFRDRIAFMYSKNKKTAYLIDIGDHTIYF